MIDRAAIRLRMHPAALRITALGLLAILAAARGSGAPKAATSASPAATITPAAARAQLACHAQAIRARHGADTTIGVRVRTVARAWVTASEKPSNGRGAAGRASARGRRTLWFQVGGSAPGDRVVVDVRVSRLGRKGSCQALLLPRLAGAAAAPTQPASPSAPSSSSPAAPAPSTSAPAPPATATSCYPLSNEGTCYEPGEYCRNDDHGVTGVAGDGEKIICEYNDGWRWEPV